MTLNLTELKDEPLGKHPIHAVPYCGSRGCFVGTADTEQVVGSAADDEGIFSFDDEDLSDEALDYGRTRYDAGCLFSRPCHMNDQE